MALNPDKVADILFAPLNFQCVGDWDRDGQTAVEIERKANERWTSPESFTKWLLSQWYIRLAKGVDEESFREKLITDLQKATLQKAIAPQEDHHLLLIESDKELSQKLMELFLYEFRDAQLEGQVQATYVEQPAYSDTDFKFQLLSYTGALLHNLSASHLQVIIDLASEKPEAVQGVVVVRTSATATDEFISRYKTLSKLGIPVVMKPFGNYDEIARILFRLA